MWCVAIICDDLVSQANRYFFATHSLSRTHQQPHTQLPRATLCSMRLGRVKENESANAAYLIWCVYAAVADFFFQQLVWLDECVFCTSNISIRERWILNYWCGCMCSHGATNRLKIKIDQNSAILYGTHIDFGLFLYHTHNLVRWGAFKPNQLESIWLVFDIKSFKWIENEAIQIFLSKLTN